MEAYNHTKMIRYRGHSPSEMVNKFQGLSNMVTVLEASERDDVISGVADELLRKGFDIISPDYKKLKGIPARYCMIKKMKIYPNSPCPCGSGKKYKKCCGI